MKKFLLTTTCTIILASPAVAAEPETDIRGLYISPKFIVAHGKLNDIDVAGTNVGEGYDTMTGIALAIGYDFDRLFKTPIRTEVEFAVRSDAKKDGISVGVKTMVANIFYDFKNSSDCTPYLGAGLGFAFVDLEADSVAGKISDSTTNFAWNIGFGANYSLNDNVALGLGYRYFDYGKAEIAKTAKTNKVTGDTVGHEFLMSIRYTF